MSKLEILAPAGSREQLEAAVRCGADAVYLGATALNARRNAANFDGEALRAAVEYCHIRGVAVHLAMNTVVLEHELGQAAELIRTACGLGVDAVIIQDLGLARMLRSMAPGLPLHASTQMAVHNLSGARQLEEIGFTRVVLAREMSAREIRTVIEGTNLQTELFIHGALCMCVSGQCYFSSVVGQRSGNRGLCAQPCRLPFYLEQRGKCDLSLKDLSLVEKIKEIEALGVSSVKIEGRMKRPEYVAAAVTACKQALAGERPDVEKLQAVFSRSGFTDGYYKGELGAAMFGTRQKEDVLSTEKVLSSLAQLYQKEQPRVPLRAGFVLQQDKPSALTLKDREGHSAISLGEAPEIALYKPTTPPMVEQALGKLGGTPYYLEKLELACGEGLALPISQLNALRRSAVEDLSAQRGALKPIFCRDVPLDRKQGFGRKKPRKPALRGRFSSLEQVPDGAWDFFEEILLPPQAALEALRQGYGAKLAVELPRVDFDDYNWCEDTCRQLRKSGVQRALAGNLGALWRARQWGFEVCGGWSLNLTNSWSFIQAAALGCADAVASYELSLQQIRRLDTPLPYGMIAYGHLPLMITRNCPVRLERSCNQCKGLAMMQDRKGNRFPVGCLGQRRVTEIYNCQPLWLADRLPELAGVDFLLLYFTYETAWQCAEVLRDYQKGAKREGITRGLYYRNIY